MTKSERLGRSLPWGAPLSRIVASSLTLLCGLAATGHAQVLYSNFGAGHTFSSAPSFAIGGTGCGSKAIAAKFQPPASAFFQDAQLALSLSSGTNQLSIYLESDSAGVPGTILEGPISVTGLASSPGSVITANSTVFPFLLAGNAYWLVVTAPTANTCATWYSTTSDTSTNLSSNTDDSPAPPWTAVATGSQRPAFEIDGDPASGDRTPFQVHYVTHVNTGGDSFIDITNDGQSVVSYGMLEGLQLGGAEANLCIGVYFFDATEELQACCACEVTPNGLVSLSVRANYATNLNQSPDSEVVKLLSWAVTSTPLPLPIQARLSQPRLPVFAMRPAQEF